MLCMVYRNIYNNEETAREYSANQQMFSFVQIFRKEIKPNRI
jgi:hypothetical protein